MKSDLKGNDLKSIMDVDDSHSNCGVFIVILF